VRITGPAVIGQDGELNDGASIENAILWDKVSIGANARLNRCIIGSNTVIGNNQNIMNSIVTPARTVPLSIPVGTADK
jgi:NDP-sugar pyrophosphorylase family protein